MKSADIQLRRKLGFPRCFYLPYLDKDSKITCQASRYVYKGAFSHMGFKLSRVARQQVSRDVAALLGVEASCPEVRFIMEALGLLLPMDGAAQLVQARFYAQVVRYALSRLPSLDCLPDGWIPVSQASMRYAADAESIWRICGKKYRGVFIVRGFIVAAVDAQAPVFRMLCKSWVSARDIMERYNLKASASVTYRLMRYNVEFRTVRRGYAKMKLYNAEQVEAAMQSFVKDSIRPWRIKLY